MLSGCDCSDVLLPVTVKPWSAGRADPARMAGQAQDGVLGDHRAVGRDVLDYAAIGDVPFEMEPGLLENVLGDMGIAGEAEAERHEFMAVRQEGDGGLTEVIHAY